MRKLITANRGGRVALLTGAGIAALLTSNPALAQDTDEDNSAVGDTQVSEPEEIATEADGSVQDDGAIVVTGSRISRPNFDTVEPSVVVDSEQIEARGFETLGQALNEQPSFGVPGSSPVGGQSDFGQGQSFVNFLGLGSQRTLTLVNGRRFVSSNTATIFGPTGAGSQVDLNVIPTKLVERVETIAVGGAPIYGSDAISGTINVILKQDYEGFELDGQYGLASRGDASNYRIRALAGTNFADGRGNVTLAGEYNEGDGLTFPDRDVTSSGLFFRSASDPASGFIQELYRNRTIPSIAETGIPYVGSFFDINVSPSQLSTWAALGTSFPDFDGNGIPGTFDDLTVLFGGEPGTGIGTVGGLEQLRFDNEGNLIPIDFGRFAGFGGDPATGTPGSFGIDFEGGNGFSLVPVSNLLSKTRRYSAIGTLNFDLADDVRLFGEAWYSKSRGTNLRSQPVYNTGLFDAPGTPDGSIILSINNAFLSPEARADIQEAIDNNPYSDQNFDGVAGQDYFYLGRANTDLQSGESVGTVEVIRGVLGLESQFEFLGREWTAELAGVYGRSETNGRSRELIQQNFENAVDAVFDASGNIVCNPGFESSPFPSISSQCAPLNLFGTNQVSQEALDYVTAIADPRSLNEQWDFTAFLAGPIFALPGGDFSVSIGAEHREESQDFNPGAFFRGELQDDGTYTSYGRSVPIADVFGEFNTDEVFGEFLAEVISPSTGSFIELLEVKGAARFINHSIAGKDWAYTIGGRFGIVPDFTVRGNFTRSVRAPAITEAFNPSSDFFGFAVDPCDADNIGNGPNPAVRAANCAAAGISQPFDSLSNSRSFSQAIEGNANLENEKADSWTVGVVFEPTFLPRFRASVDYVDIQLEDVISQLSGSAVVANCYDSGNFGPDNEFCRRVSRDADGQLDFIRTGYFNSALLTYKGYLGSVQYIIPEIFGANDQLGFQLSYQYLDTLASRADNNPDTAESRTDGEVGYSKHQGVATLSYNNEQFGVFTQASYIGEAQINSQAVDNFYPNGLNDLESKIFVNMGANFNVTDKFELRMVVDNVFDEKPPFPYPASGGTSTYFRGILGTYFRVGATVKY